LRAFKTGTARQLTFAKEAAMPWILLITAGVFETVWAYYMKLSDGFSRPGATIATFAAMAVSIGLLGLAMKSLPLGTAYMVWTGIGAVGAFVVGILVLGEAVTPLRLFAAALIVAGIGLMKVSSPV
jgi:quaternary ammonium compound-resistance protein SugE